MHQAGRKKSVLDDVTKRFGCNCANCGSPEMVEYHHIVPLYVGGTNNPTNIIPLCASCHYLVHHGVRLDKTVLKKMRGGRPRAIATDEQKKAFEDYLFCRLPGIRVKEILNTNHIDPSRNKWMKEIMDANNVVSFRNHLESSLVNKVHGVAKGQPVGYWYCKNNPKKRITIFADEDMTAEQFGLVKRYHRTDDLIYGKV